jgi:uncharacterized membrane protein YkoI
MTMTPRTTKVAAFAIAAVAAFSLAVLAIDELLDGDDEYVVMQAPAAAAPASGDRPTLEESSAPAPDGRVDAQRAMEIGAAAAGGTAIDVWPGTEGGREVFYVDVRTDTGLVEAYVDAATGEVLEIQPGE